MARYGLSRRQNRTKHAHATPKVLLGCYHPRLGCGGFGGLFRARSGAERASAGAEPRPKIVHAANIGPGAGASVRGGVLQAHHPSARKCMKNYMCFMNMVEQRKHLWKKLISEKQT